MTAPADAPSAIEASVAAYLVPDAPDYLQPTLTFDRGALHLEGRYNYEDRNTGSVFLGWNAGWDLGEGPGVRLDLVPMLGGVFGRTIGVAPGLRLDVAWRRLVFHAESEYVIDVRHAADTFFYAWSQLGLTFGDHVQAGLVTQRTRVFHTPRAVALGPFAQVDVGRFEAGAYVFDPFDRTRFFVATLAVTF